ncbi:MAG TPA: PAS domain-containing sensor histidine kinase [Bacteroidales bacterium]|nr:PAS domain-containing sensor histidine kinase [Bacteroidales bacterium]
MNRYIPELLKNISPMVMVLTRNRQIVYVNKSMEQFLGIADAGELLGTRPGEAMRCEYADVSRSGCGASAFCKYCGFNQALFDAEIAKPASKYDCHLLNKAGNTYNLGVSVTPFEYMANRYMFCVIENRADSHYRDLLENIFSNNLKSILSSMQSLVKASGSLSPAEFQPLMRAQLMQIDEVINNFDILQKIESGEPLPGRQEWFSVKQLVDEVITNLRLRQDLRLKYIKKAIPDLMVFSNRTLLGYVLSSIVKNAMEAENDRNEILVSVIDSTATISFKIKNQSVMDEKQQKLVFTRFAAGGEGKMGLGTYCAKKLATNYLSGKISFISNREKGTVFTIRIPKLVREESLTSI